MRNRNTLRDLETIRRNSSTKDMPAGFGFVLDGGDKAFSPYTLEAVRAAGFRCRVVAGFLDRENHAAYEIYLQGLIDDGLPHPHNTNNLPQIPLLSEGPAATLKFIDEVF